MMRNVSEAGRVPWQPEDWTEWSDAQWSAGHCEPVHLHAVQDILSRLADGGRRQVGELTRGPFEPLCGVAHRFERVVTVDLDDARPDRPLLPGGLDVVVAVDAIGLRDADATFVHAHGALVEGGVFLATLPARVLETNGAATLSGPSPSGFHEFELQYRLMRAGFQGLRLRRLRGVDDEPDRILCMGVRRALN